MLKGVPVKIYKMVIVIGINQIVIVLGKDVTGGHIGSGQTHLFRLKYFKDLLLIVVQVPALLVAKVYRGLPVANYLDGIVHPYCPMIRSND